jgi:hypothetical protein
VRNFTLWKIALGALLIAALLPARANVGDTMQELRQRYGSAKDMGGQWLFEVRVKGGQITPAHEAADKDTHFTITVYFDGDRSGMEVFTRNTSDPAKANMSQDDINAILNAMGGQIPWTPIEAKSGKPTWVWGNDKSKPPLWMARFDPPKSASPDDAAVLVVMEYTEK